eukprot:scpid31725/ scgid26382/ 
MQKNVVYEIKCKECPEQNVGETGCFLEKRLEEHTGNGEARRQTRDKPWGDHFRTSHPSSQIAIWYVVRVHSLQLPLSPGNQIEPATNYVKPSRSTTPGPTLAPAPDGNYCTSSVYKN